MSLWQAFCDIMATRNYRLPYKDKVLDQEYPEIQDVNKMNEELDRLGLKSRYSILSSLLPGFRRYSEGYISRLSNGFPCMEHNVCFTPSLDDALIFQTEKGIEFIHELNFSIGRQLSPRGGNMLTQLAMVNEQLYENKCNPVSRSLGNHWRDIRTQPRVSILVQRNSIHLW